MLLEHDPHALQRFVEAQKPVIDAVRRELSAGRKTSHWMWFVFPQLRSLGRSSIARRFGIAGVAEAAAYAAHPVLGPRLVDCCARLDSLRGRSAHEIFGSPDDLKLCSCLTLFERAAPEQPLFARLLDRYYAGCRDRLTVEELDHHVTAHACDKDR